MAAASASSSTELKCNNCFRSYQLKGLKGSSGRRHPLLPLLLTCGHTFCSQCIPKFSPPSTSSIRCPMCQVVAPYNPQVDAAKQIPPNLHLLGLLYSKQHSLPSVASESAAGKVILDPDLWTKLTPVPPSPAALDDSTKPCEECCKLTRHKCRQCGVPLCKECFRMTHSAAVFLRKHELIAILSSTFSTCPLHELPMDRFCSSDRVTFCSKCASAHTGHNVTLIDEKSGELHDKLRPLLDSARKVLRSMKRSHATVSDEGLAFLKEQLFQLMGQVEQQFIFLHTALQTRCLQLMNSLALAAEAQATDLQTICNKLKDGIGRLTDTMTYIQEVSEDSSQLVQCGDRILAELNILLELPCSLRSAEKDPLRCHLDDSVYETFKDYGTVVPPAMAWYSIGTVTVGSDNDMSDVEDNDRAEPYSSVMDDVREVGNESGCDGADAEDVDEQREERESTEGPGSVTMETSSTHSAMETTWRVVDSGGEEDGSEGDSITAAADTLVPRESLRDITPSSSPSVHTQRHEGGLLFLPQSEERKRHLSPLSTSTTEPSPLRGGSGVKQSSQGSPIRKAKAVEKKSPSKRRVPSSGARASGLSIPVRPWQDAEGGGGMEGGTEEEVEPKEDDGNEAPHKGDQEDSHVLVVHVDNPGKFFVRYKREVSQFDRLMGQLNAHQQDRMKMRAKEISIGTLCASSYSGGEGRLYRAEVSSLPAKAFPFYTVKYIDLGDMESVKLERLYHLPKSMASVLPFAHCCKLAHIGPILMSSKYPDMDVPVMWGDRATLNFKTQLGNRELKIDIVSCETDCLVVDLHMLMVTEWVSVAERLVNKGLAQWEKNAEEEEEEEKEEEEEVVMEKEEQRSLSIQQIPLGDTQLDCVVSEAGSPSNFYIQILGDNVSELQDLMNALQQEALVAERVAHPASGVLCMGLFTDRQWYRASIEDVSVGRDEVTVRYVDFGNTERVPVEHLRQINSSVLNLPAQAIPCSLTSVVPVGDGGDWSKEACRIFSSLLTNTRVQAEVQEQRRGLEGVLQLHIIDPPIEDTLVAEKVAMFSGPLAFPPATIPQSGDLCRGFVVHVDTPFLFHFRKYDPTSDQRLEAALQQVSSSHPSRVLTWSSGDCCCTHFFGDTSWHRAVVTKQTEKEAEYEVYYSDYGNTAVVRAEEMVPISHPELLAVPQQALCCRLANIAPLEEVWSRGACVFFSTAVMNQLVVMEVKDVDLREAASLSVEINLSLSEAYSSGPTRMTESLITNGYALSTDILRLQPYDGPSYRPHPLPDDNPFKMMVICVQNDGQVVGQLEENQAELEVLMEKVQIVCGKNKTWLGGLSELRRGQPCCAKFSEDNLWYRAVIDGIVNGRALVCYIDFGNCEEVPIDCIVPKPVCIDVPVKSVCLQVAQTESLTWNESVAQILTEIVSDKQCTVHMKEPFEIAGSAYGSLQLDTGEDVVQTLLEQLQK